MGFYSTSEKDKMFLLKFFIQKKISLRKIIKITSARIYSFKLFSIEIQVVRILPSAFMIIMLFLLPPSTLHDGLTQKSLKEKMYT